MAHNHDEDFVTLAAAVLPDLFNDEAFDNPGRQPRDANDTPDGSRGRGIPPWCPAVQRSVRERTWRRAERRSPVGCWRLLAHGLRTVPSFVRNMARTGKRTGLGCAEGDSWLLDG